MKTRTPQFGRLIYFLTAFLLLSVSGYAAGYEIEEGYIINPVEITAGTVFTDEYESTVYLLNNGKVETLFSSPGAGRYLNFSTDGKLIGYKYINPETGKQQSAIYDISRGESTYLTEPVMNAGQVSFSDDGKMAFTVDNTLFISSTGGVASYDLGYYNNRVTISPDGNSVIYKDGTEQLFLLDLVSGTSEQITNIEHGLGNVAWSFDSKYIAFETIDARIFVQDLDSREITFVAEGEEPKWSPKELLITFYKKDIDFNTYTLINTDVFVYNVNNKQLENFTNTPEVKETNPSFANNSLVYSTYFDREIVKQELSNEQKSVIYSLESSLKPEFFEQYQGLALATEDLPEYVHIHQVYDTKQSWDQGRVCCGATSAMEVIASYEILDPVPITTYGHTSNFGYYVSDPYTYKNYTYTGYTGRWSYGGHGYLWNTSSVYGSSPYSNTKSYLERHDIIASRADYISWSMVQNEMELEYPYILCSTGLTSGHIVVAVGLYNSSSHTLYFNDPYGDKNAGSYGYIRNGKNAVYDWSDANTGHIKVTPVVWAVKAHYQYRMKVESVYPQENLVDASCSIETRVQFDVAVDPATLDGKISMVSEDGTSIPFTVNENALASGLLCVEPLEMLEPFTYYTVKVENGIMNTEGNPLKEDIIRTFKTGVDFIPEGQIINDFDNLSDWKDVKTNPATVGVNSENTSFTLDNSRAYSGNNSGKISYESSTSTFEVRLEAAQRNYISQQTDSAIAVAIFGDNSGNEAILHLEDEAGTTYPFLLETLDYTGWKVKFIPLVQVPFEGKIYFNSFAVKSKYGGATSGNVYFDMLTSGKTPTVIMSHYPEDDEIGIPVDEKVTISFNKPMDVESLESAVTITPETAGIFSWSADSTKFYFTPSQSWSGKTDYTVSMDETAKDSKGYPVYSAYEFNFQTERVELLMMDNYPHYNMTDISRTVEIRLTFDGAIDQSTLGGRIFLRDEQDNKVGVRVNTGVYSEGKIVFEPQSALKRNALYKVVLGAGIGDASGLLLKQDKEIEFRTETTEVISGNIVEDFDDIDNWTQPDQSSFSFGLNADNTKINLQSMKKVEGYSAFQLDYHFTRDSAKCVLYSELKPNVGADGEFGIWVFGDRSGNTLEYFLNSGEEHFIEIDKIDWTGWKFKSINLGDYANGNDKAFVWLAINHDGTGATTGTIYIDGMQNNVVTDIKETEELPVSYSLSQNYPNPFNPSTNISFTLPEAGIVKLEVYNILGEKVSTLVNREMKAGAHQVEFNGVNLTSGVYFYRIETAGFNAVRKMIFLK